MKFQKYAAMFLTATSLTFVLMPDRSVLAETSQCDFGDCFEIYHCELRECQRLLEDGIAWCTENFPDKTLRHWGPLPGTDYPSCIALEYRYYQGCIQYGAAKRLLACLGYGERQ